MHLSKYINTSQLLSRLFIKVNTSVGFMWHSIFPVVYNYFFSSKKSYFPVRIRRVGGWSENYKLRVTYLIGLAHKKTKISASSTTSAVITLSVFILRRILSFLWNCRVRFDFLSDWDGYNIFHRHVDRCDVRTSEIERDGIEFFTALRCLLFLTFIKRCREEFSFVKK